MRTIRAFDLYRKVPRDLTEPTLTGAAFSLCTVTLAIYLFTAEFMTFVQTKWESQMTLDESRTEDKIQINIDVVMPKMPCEILSFDAQDVMGSHEVDVLEELFKERLSATGEVISKEPLKRSHYGASSGLTRHPVFSYDNTDIDSIQKMLHSGEGCRVAGHVRVNKVPGNVHLSTYSHSYLFGSIYQEMKKVNMSHTVNHLSFGNETDVNFVRENYKKLGVVGALDGVTHNNNQSNTGMYDSAIFEYYTKVVPTIYEPLSGKPRNIYQYTANSNRIVNQQMPSLYIRYDFSPVSVKYTEVRESTSHFLVQICAVIGGLFTIAGVFDSLVYRGIVHLAKKSQIGKLG